MFLWQVLLTSLLILTLGTISAEAACPPGNPRSNRYLRRDGNRCEGIVRQLPGESNTGPLRIISFTIVNQNANNRLDNIPTLPIRINYLNPISTPEITIQDLQTKYLLDELDFSPNSVSFDLPTDVLKRIPVNPDNLRSLANYFDEGSSPIWIPIILGNSSGNEYKFVLFTQYRASFPQLEIQAPNGRIVYQNPRPHFSPSGEVFFTWDGHDENGNQEPAGRYILHVSAVQEQEEAEENITISIPFEHDPQWLK